MLYDMPKKYLNWVQSKIAYTLKFQWSSDRNMRHQAVP